MTLVTVNEGTWICPELYIKADLMKPIDDFDAVNPDKGL
jgi:hypothetical protein